MILRAGLGVGGGALQYAHSQLRQGVTTLFTSLGFDIKASEICSSLGSFDGCMGSSCLWVDGIHEGFAPLSKTFDRFDRQSFIRLL